MLVLTRKLNQSIVIQDNIIVKVVEIGDGSVKIGIEAPKAIPIHREEVYEEIQKENMRAADLPKELNLKGLIKE
ncbi:MAG: carbon storage regulator CsrA [Candidatus Margulisbacteria bacterium]|nr:carbon storage regulator CsrA [Candidatus Margulisiibacteriota bacterium]